MDEAQTYGGLEKNSNALVTFAVVILNLKRHSNGQVMAAAKLVIKNNGKLKIFEVDGVEWMDGRIEADLPFKSISTLSNILNYIVCQTNFHVVPFLRKAHHPSKKSLYWSIFETCEWDIRNRGLNVNRLGLFPKMFGHDISKIFKQKYHGNLTLVPTKVYYNAKTWSQSAGKCHL